MDEATIIVDVNSPLSDSEFDFDMPKLIDINLDDDSDWGENVSHEEVNSLFLLHIIYF